MIKTRKPIGHTIKPLLDSHTQPYIDAALVLHKANNDSEALKLVNKALTQHPTNGKALVLAGLIHQDAGMLEKAEAAFRKAWKNNTEDTDAIKSLGLFLITHDQIDEGIKLLSDYLERGNWTDEIVLQALTSVKDINKEKAKKLLIDAWEMTLSPKIGELAANQLRNMGEYDLAIPILKLITKASPTPRRLNQYAINLHFRREFETAIEVYNQAIKLGDNQLEKQMDNFMWSEEGVDGPDESLGDEINREMLSIFYGNLSSCYLDAGQKDYALIAAEQGIDLDPRSGYLTYQKIKALFALEKYEEVIQASKDVIDFLHSDEYQDVIFNKWAQSLIRIGRLDEALTLLETVQGKFPKNIKIYFLKFDILREQSRLDEAAKVLEDAFQTLEKPTPGSYLDAEYSWKQVDLYDLLFQLGQEEKALKYIAPRMKEDDNIDYFEMMLNPPDKPLERYIRELEHINTHYPNNPGVIQAMFDLRFGQGYRNLAEDVLEKALDAVIPTRAKLIFLNNLGYLYLLRGKFPAAEEIFYKALTIQDVETYETHIGILAVAFFLDGEILDGNWGEYAQRFKYLGPHRLPSLIWSAIKYNLITLALAHGNADEATSLLMEILHRGEEKDNELKNLATLFIARFRNDRKTAQYSWQRLQEAEWKELDEKVLRKLYPDLASWLIDNPC